MDIYARPAARAISYDEELCVMPEQQSLKIYFLHSAQLNIYLCVRVCLLMCVSVYRKKQFI